MKITLSTYCCIMAIMLSGCAATKVTERQTFQHETLPRPDRILVYDFAATYEDLPSWSAPARKYDATMTTSPGEELEKGRGRITLAELTQLAFHVGTGNRRHEWTDCWVTESLLPAVELVPRSDRDEDACFAQFTKLIL